MEPITLEDIKCAYRKLKSYVYYDNYSLKLRHTLAEFENDANFDKKLIELVSFLNKTDEYKTKDAHYNELLKSIKYSIVPKSFVRDDLDDDFILTNCFTADHYKIGKVNYIIDAPIELHIISVLWILKEGVYLSKSYNKSNYANSLEINPAKGKVVDGLRLFKPYFEQYQKWRDGSVETALDFIEKDVDVVVVGLDIKEYYYHIDYDAATIKKIKNTISSFEKENQCPLTKLLFQIHDTYIAKLRSDKHKVNSKNFVPIGMLSSGVLANWYLKDFDQQILDKLSPAFYGRYVDDILIVLSNTRIPSKKKTKEAGFSSRMDMFLNEFFVKRDILISNKKSEIASSKYSDFLIKRSVIIPLLPKELMDTDHNYTLSKYKNMFIQKEKISIHSFNSKESKAVLEKFKQNIQKNSSVFWFLPDNQALTDSFNESVYELAYSDTVNKLRSVSEIKQSKYGASVFLAQKIKLSLLSNQKYDEKTKEQILTFFKGRMNLEFYTVWEKVLTYFVINNDHTSFWSFFKETMHSIDKIVVNGVENAGPKTSEFLVSDLKEFLYNCSGIALSLNPGFLNDFLVTKLTTLEDK